MEKEETREVVFGTFDGATSAIGVVGAAVISGNYTGLTTLLVGLAVAAAASMGAGEWLQDPGRSMRRALIMGLATLAGSLIPVIPYTFGLSHLMQALMTVGAMAVIGIFVSWLRPGNWGKSLVQTFTVLVLASGLAVMASGILSLMK